VNFEFSEKVKDLQRRGNSGTRGQTRRFLILVSQELAWLIMTGHFRERETSRLSPSVVPAVDADHMLFRMLSHSSLAP